MYSNKNLSELNLKKYLFFIALLIHPSWSFSQCTICDSFEEALKNPEQVVQLTISNVDSVTIPNTIGRLKKLESFAVFRVHGSLPDEFYQLSSLKNLTIKGEIDSISSKIKNLSSLENATFSCKLKYIDPALFSLSSLVQLRLTHNHFTHLSGEISNLKNLEILNVSFNKNLIELPNSFGNMQSLRELILNNNKLEKLPLHLTSLPVLKFIYAHNNQLTSVNFQGVNNESLQICNLSNNNIDSVSHIENFLYLSHLDLSTNKLKSLPISVCNCSNLYFLAVSNNDINYVSKSIKNLSNLDKLLIENNQLTELPNEFTYLSSLRSLLISNNPLSSFPPSMEKMKSLKIIELYNVEIYREQRVELQNKLPNTSIYGNNTK